MPVTTSAWPAVQPASARAARAATTPPKPPPPRRCRACRCRLEMYYAASNETLRGLHPRSRSRSACCATANPRPRPRTPRCSRRSARRAEGRRAREPRAALGARRRRRDRPDDAHPYGQGYTAPSKVYYAPEMSGEIADACAVDGLTDAEYRATVLRPAADAASAPGDDPAERVFLANNDFVAMNVHAYGDWAEESLLMAERALRALHAQARLARRALPQHVVAPGEGEGPVSCSRGICARARVPTIGRAQAGRVFFLSPDVTKPP